MGMDLRAGHTEESVLFQMLTANGDYVLMQQAGSWVRALYQDVLDRQPGPSETAAWLGVLQSGASFTAIATAIASSSEANSLVISTPQLPAGSTVRVGQVQGFYQKLLDRNASAAEEQGWVNELGSGVSRTSIELAIVSSNEFFAEAGSTLTGFINLAFSRLLGRAASASDISNFVNDPNFRVDVPTAILVTVGNEYNTDLVNTYFNAYLGRFPFTPSNSRRLAQVDYSSAQGFINQLNAGTNPITVQLEILTSAEFFNDALYKQFWLGARWLS
jgi:hypothetical protein